LLVGLDSDWTKISSWQEGIEVSMSNFGIERTRPAGEIDEVMKHTPEQERAFKEIFAVRRRRQILLAVPLVATMLAFIVGTEEQAETIFGFPLAVAAPIFFAFIVGALIFSFKNWRCPACDKYLGKVWSPRHCHSCGVALQ